MDTPKDILISYYNEIHEDKRLDAIKGQHDKNSILNLLENIIDELQEAEDIQDGIANLAEDAYKGWQKKSNQYNYTYKCGDLNV